MTKKNSKKSTKNTHTNINSIKEKRYESENNNEIYNYICIGVIIIIIIFFICKEQMNKNEGFQVHRQPQQTKEKHKIKKEITSFKNIYRNIFLDIRAIYKIGDDFDTEPEYNKFYSLNTKINNNINILKSKKKYIIKLMDNFIAKYGESSLIKVSTASFLNSIIGIVENIKKGLEKLINDSKGNKKIISNKVSITDDTIKFNLNITAKMFLKENPSIYYVYLYKDTTSVTTPNLDESGTTKEIYGPIILISDNEYKLLDINSKAIKFDSNNPIKIKGEDIINELLKKYNDEATANTLFNNIITRDNNYFFYGEDQNTTTNIINSDTPFRISDSDSTVNILKKIIEKEIKTIKTNLWKGKQNYDTKLTDTDNLNSIASKLNDIDTYTSFDSKSGSPQAYESTSIWQNLQTELTTNSNNIEYSNIFHYYNTDLPQSEDLANYDAADNIYTEKIKNDKLDENNEKLDRLCTKYLKIIETVKNKYVARKNATTSNQYEPQPKEANRILGNNSDFFQDGIIDVGVFEFNRD